MLVIGSVLGYSQTPNQLYQNGRSAYNSNDFVRANQYFYAYKVIMGDEIATIAKKPLNEAIVHCEWELNSALRIQRSVKNGKVTRTTTESEGKMDNVSSSGSNYNKTKLPNFRTDYNPLVQVDHNDNSEEVLNLKRDLSNWKRSAQRLRSLNLTLESQNKRHQMTAKRYKAAYEELKKKCGGDSKKTKH